jgi:excisionase family DNA binding protein
VPQLLTMDDLAERLGVSHRHVRRLVDERRIPFLKVGKFVRFDPAEVAKWLRSTRVPVALASTTGISSSAPFRVGRPLPTAREQGGHR